MDIPINAQVCCTDGLCGRSTRLVINPKTAEVTHLVVKEHRFPYIEFLVPLDRVTASTAQGIDLDCRVDELARFQPLDIYLKLGKEQIEKLPTVGTRAKEA